MQAFFTGTEKSNIQTLLKKEEKKKELMGQQKKNGKRDRN